MENKNVIVGISGGVDSAAALITLQQEGYNITGCYVQMLDNTENDKNTAEELCKNLHIPFIHVNAVNDFKTYVSDRFCRDYCSGKTPNPCVLCNPLVKFKYLLSAADSCNAGFIATGHYAKINHDDGIYCVGISDNIKKDQSYMLYSLPQSILKRLLLPIGNNEKSKNRELVKSFGLSVYNSKDSQDICFVPDGNYIDFIHSHGFHGPSGSVLSPEGSFLRRHDGIEYFTVGQRKGLSGSYPGPIFVKEIDPCGDIKTSRSDGLFSSNALVEETVINPLFYKRQDSVLYAKVRYSSSMTECTVDHDRVDNLILHFRDPVRAITPGQSAVIYSGNDIIAGGIIKKAF